MKVYGQFFIGWENRAVVHILLATEIGQSVLLCPMALLCLELQPSHETDQAKVVRWDFFCRHPRGMMRPFLVLRKQLPRRTPETTTAFSLVPVFGESHKSAPRLLYPSHLSSQFCVLLCFHSSLPEQISVRGRCQEVPESEECASNFSLFKCSDNCWAILFK